MTEDFLQHYQAGFRRGMGTTDQIFCLRQIAQKSKDMNTETLHLFIDFKSAYDTVNREELWHIMVQNGFPFKLIRLLKATLDEVKCCVKVQNSLSEYFESKVGLRQGDELSTKLFNIALEGVVRRSGTETSGSIFNKSVQLLAYADDIDIVARNMRSLTDAYSRIEKEANKIGLHVNESKTKLMMVSPSQRNRALLGTSLIIGDKNFEVVDSFTYLGVVVNERMDTSIEIKRRIVAALRASYGVSQILSSRNITRNTKFKIYKTLIRPVAIYGAESWSTTAADEERLGVFERKILRRIIGPKRVGEDRYQQRNNLELYQIFKEADIVTVVRHRRLSWAGHVVRREENLPVQRVFNSNFNDGKRSRGRPKTSWEDAVENDCAAFGLTNWRKAATDRGKFRNFLDAVKARARAE
jgi:hypothetical protein